MRMPGAYAPLARSAASVGLDAIEQRARLVGAGRELAGLDEEQGDVLRGVGEAPALALLVADPARRISSRCPTGRAVAAAGCRRGACPAPSRPRSPAAPRCRSGSLQVGRVDVERRVALEERLARRRCPCGPRGPSRVGMPRMRAARSSRSRSPEARSSGRPVSTTTPRYCSPGSRARSSSSARTLGDSRGRSSSSSLLRCP